jgi:hypothetical protein
MTTCGLAPVVYTSGQRGQRYTGPQMSSIRAAPVRTIRPHKAQHTQAGERRIRLVMMLCSSRAVAKL